MKAEEAVVLQSLKQDLMASTTVSQVLVMFLSSHLTCFVLGFVSFLDQHDAKMAAVVEPSLPSRLAM